jgi:hypothetical protein
LCTGFLGRWRAYFRRQLLANAAMAASRVGYRHANDHAVQIDTPESVVEMS